MPRVEICLDSEDSDDDNQNEQQQHQVKHCSQLSFPTSSQEAEEELERLEQQQTKKQFSSTKATTSSTHSTTRRGQFRLNARSTRRSSIIDAGASIGQGRQERRQQGGTLQRAPPKDITTTTRNRTQKSPSKTKQPSRSRPVQSPRITHQPTTHSDHDAVGFQVVQPPTSAAKTQTTITTKPKEQPQTVVKMVTKTTTTTTKATEEQQEPSSSSSSRKRKPRRRSKQNEAKAPLQTQQQAKDGDNLEMCEVVDVNKPVSKGHQKQPKPQQSKKSPKSAVRSKQNNLPPLEDTDTEDDQRITTQQAPSSFSASRKRKPRPTAKQDDKEQDNSDQDICEVVDVATSKGQKQQTKKSPLNASKPPVEPQSKRKYRPPTTSQLEDTDEEEESTNKKLCKQKISKASEKKAPPIKARAKKDDGNTRTKRRRGSKAGSKSQNAGPAKSKTNKPSAAAAPKRQKDILKVGDKISYFHPMYAYGREEGYRETRILAVEPLPVDPSSQVDYYPLQLENGEVLPADTRVRRLVTGREKSMEDFVLVAGTCQGPTGLQRQAARVGQLYREAQEEMQHIPEHLQDLKQLGNKSKRRSRPDDSSDSSEDDTDGSSSESGSTDVPKTNESIELDSDEDDDSAPRRRATEKVGKSRHVQSTSSPTRNRSKNDSRSPTRAKAHAPTLQRRDRSLSTENKKKRPRTSEETVSSSTEVIDLSQGSNNNHIKAKRRGKADTTTKKSHFSRTNGRLQSDSSSSEESEDDQDLVSPAPSPKATNRRIQASRLRLPKEVKSQETCAVQEEQGGGGEKVAETEGANDSNASPLATELQHSACDTSGEVVVMEDPSPVAQSLSPRQKEEGENVHPNHWSPDSPSQDKKNERCSTSSSLGLHSQPDEPMPLEVKRNERLLAMSQLSAEDSEKEPETSHPHKELLNKSEIEAKLWEDDDSVQLLDGDDESSKDDTEEEESPEIYEVHRPCRQETEASSSDHSDDSLKQKTRKRKSSFGTRNKVKRQELDQSFDSNREEVDLEAHQLDQSSEDDDIAVTSKRSMSAYRRKKGKKQQHKQKQICKPRDQAPAPNYFDPHRLWTKDAGFESSDDDPSTNGKRQAAYVPSTQRQTANKSRSKRREADEHESVQTAQSSQPGRRRNHYSISGRQKRSMNRMSVGSRQKPGGMMPLEVKKVQQRVGSDDDDSFF